MSSMLDHTYIQSLARELKSLVDKSEDTVASNRLAALDLARKLAEALETPQDAVFQDWLMLTTLSCLKIAVDLDLFRMMVQYESNNITAADMGDISGAERLLIVRIMRVLTAQGYAKEVGEATYSCTPKGKAMTKSTNIAGLRHAFNLNLQTTLQLPAYFQMNQYKNPNSSLMTPFQYAHDTKASYFEYMQQHPAIADNFNVLMQGIRGDRASWIDWFPVQERVLDEAKDDAQAVLMVDFGGGKGHDLMAFRSRFPEAPGRMMLQDQPHVVKDAILNDGVEKMAHDMFTQQPIKGARIYFEHFVLHDWDEEKSVQILKNTASAMTPGYSKLYLNEWILPKTGCSLYEATIDIAMLFALAAMERTESQWSELLQRAGLKLEKFWLPEEYGEGIVEASL